MRAIPDGARPAAVLGNCLASHGSLLCLAATPCSVYIFTCVGGTCCESFWSHVSRLSTVTLANGLGLAARVALPAQPQSAAWSTDGALLCIVLPTAVHVFAGAGSGVFEPIFELPVLTSPKMAALTPVSDHSHVRALVCFACVNKRVRLAHMFDSTCWPWHVPTASALSKCTGQPALTPRHPRLGSLREPG
jgi:hypothetical protein